MTGNEAKIVSENKVTVMPENGATVMSENKTVMSENKTKIISENENNTVLYNGARIISENETKIISLIGIARKAGKVICGTDRSVDSIRKEKKKGIKLLFCSTDASQNTVKRIRNTSSFYKIPLYTLSITKEELAKITGCEGAISVIGITDAGFCRAMLERISAKR